MTITPGALRALTQPTIVLRVDVPVQAAPGEWSEWLNPCYAFATYVGNGRLLLTPFGRTFQQPTVVMASALNTTATIIHGRTVEMALRNAARIPIIAEVDLTVNADNAGADPDAWDAATDPTYDPEAGRMPANA